MGSPLGSEKNAGPQARAHFIDDNAGLLAALDSLFRSTGLETELYVSASGFLKAPPPVCGLANTAKSIGCWGGDIGFCIEARISRAITSGSVVPGATQNFVNAETILINSVGIRRPRTNAKYVMVLPVPTRNID